MSASTNAPEKVQKTSAVSPSQSGSTRSAPVASPSTAANRAAGTAARPSSTDRPSGTVASTAVDGYQPTQDVDENARAGTPARADEKKSPKTGVSDDQNAKVKVDSWKQGRNDCLERVMQNQGYSLKEIYARGKDGKTLLQSMAERNGLKDANKIADGKVLNIPRKANTVSAEGLKPGQTITREAQDASGSMAVTAQQNPDGSKSVQTDTQTVAPVSSSLTVQEGGAVHGSVAKTEKGLESTVVGENAKGDARTQIQTLANEKGTATRISDTDSKKNLSGFVDQNGVYAVNNGTGGGTEAGIAHGPKSKLESAGAWIDQNLNPWGPKQDAPKEFHGSSQVDHVKRPDGSVSVSADGPDGKRIEWNRGADGFFQRNLRWLNNAIFGAN